MVLKSTDDARNFAVGKAGGRISGSPWRGVALVLALVAGSMAATAAGSNASTSPTTATTALQARSSSATQVHRVSPVTPNRHLRPGYRVTKHRPARCTSPSFLNGRLYHCENDRAREFDPCWKASARSVFCLRGPWSHKVIRLHLRQRGPRGPHAFLPRTFNVGPRSWAVQLGAGLGWRCRHPQDTNPGIGTGATHISYVCDEPTPWDASRPRGWVLINELNRTPRIWTIRSGRFSADPGENFKFERRGRKPVVAVWRPVVVR
jgi:hypothetical protein